MCFLVNVIHFGVHILHILLLLLLLDLFLLLLLYNDIISRGEFFKNFFLSWNWFFEPGVINNL